MKQWVLKAGLFSSGVAMLLTNLNPERRLVDINASVAEIRRALPMADRDDFESIYPDHTILSLPSNINFEEHLQNYGLSYHDVEDVSLKNFRAEVSQSQFPSSRESDEVVPRWDRYCNHACLSQRLSSLAEPGACQLPLRVEKIGTSHEGREIWAVGIMSPDSSAPEVLMAADIHGNEPVGGQVLQQWIWSTCKDPSGKEFGAAKVVNAWYIPMLNPDGVEHNTRENGVGRDLNRGFPIPPNRGHATRTAQPEIQALINFEDTHSFVTSLMFHGGATVVNTVPDSCYSFSTQPCPPGRDPNDDLILGSAHAYADEWVKLGVNCGSWENCIVKGNEWYQITGSVQDYEYHFKKTFGMTVELSNVKFPRAAELPKFYASNINSIAAFLSWPHANPRALQQRQNESADDI